MLRVRFKVMNPYLIILHSTVARLPENTPTARLEVYAKAREGVARSVDRLDPRPSQAALGRMMEKLEAAITEVEAEQEHSRSQP